MTVQYLSQVHGIGVPGGERLQPEDGLDHLQRGRVLERAIMGDPGAGQAGHHDARHAESELPIVRNQLAVGGCGAVPGVVDGSRISIVDHLGRPHVVEEAAPLIERDDQHGVVQVARAGQAW